jgi:hypothetical protein
MSRFSSPFSWALVASLSAAALMLATSDSFARSAGAARGGVAPRPFAAPFIARHHHHRNDGAFWPGVGDYGYGNGPTDGGPYAAVTTQPTYEGPRYTCSYDMPWDWAHRCPPAVAPSDKPYAPSCPTEVMKFPGRDGTEQTVNVTRCY